MPSLPPLPTPVSGWPIGLAITIINDPIRALAGPVRPIGSTGSPGTWRKHSSRAARRTPCGWPWARRLDIPCSCLANSGRRMSGSHAREMTSR